MLIRAAFLHSGRPGVLRSRLTYFGVTSRATVV